MPEVIQKDRILMGPNSFCRMKKLRIVTIVFDAEVQPFEIPAVRGAIIEKVGRAHILFHNHLDDDKVLYRYPLIQYKVIQRRAAIVCIEYGVDEIHHYFEKEDWSIKVSDRWLSMKVFRLNLNQFNLQVWNKLFHYSIRNWLALNQQNVVKYIELATESEQRDFLANILKANILSFAKGVEWEIDKPIRLVLEGPVRVTYTNFKQKKLMAFSVNFAVNTFLPDYIGLGKGVSLGFGTVKSLRKERSTE